MKLRAGTFVRFGLALALLSAGCKRKDPIPLLTTPAAGTSSMSLVIRSVDTSASPEVRIMVQALDGSGTPITDFKLGNFSILESGRPVIPDLVGPANDPLYTVLVIDRSGSMASGTGFGFQTRNDAATAGGITYINALGASDKAAYIEFDSAVYPRVDFTSDKAALIAAISAGQPGASTAFFDAVVAAATRLEGQPGRKLLVALGDGDDNSSVNTLSSTVQAVTGKGITVFTILLGSDVTDTTNFATVASSSGGTLTLSPDGSNLNTTFLNILKQFNNLVAIRYRRRSNGDLTVFLNYGTLTASATKRFTS
jgi:hypothetical protein